LDEAVEFCRKNGIEFYAVNKNYPEEVFDEKTVSRKIQADYYIDDRNICGLPGWGEIWQIIHPELNPTVVNERRNLPRRRTLLSRLFGR
ncbi:MAG: hypothetical protein LC655_04655, partial [Bacteroidales bacterium]|nr:hypothetical protein [Bacteroidales bacterium]